MNEISVKVEGKAKSGKTTIANAIERYLIENGIKCVHIHPDDGPAYETYEEKMEALKDSLVVVLEERCTKPL